MMIVKTKFDIGDEAWLIDNNQIIHLDITRVIVSAENPENSEVTYSLHYSDYEIPENLLFKTKKELLESFSYGEEF